MTNKDQRSYNNNVPNAPLAQLVEQVTLNHKVGGSTPLWRTTAKLNINGFAIFVFGTICRERGEKNAQGSKKSRKSNKRIH